MTALLILNLSRTLFSILIISGSVIGELIPTGNGRGEVEVVQHGSNMKNSHRPISKANHVGFFTPLNTGVRNSEGGLMPNGKVEASGTNMLTKLFLQSPTTISIPRLTPEVQYYLSLLLASRGNPSCIDCNEDDYDDEEELETMSLFPTKEEHMAIVRSSGERDGSRFIRRIKSIPPYQSYAPIGQRVQRFRPPAMMFSGHRWSD